MLQAERPKACGPLQVESPAPTITTTPSAEPSSLPPPPPPPVNPTSQRFYRTVEQSVSRRDSPSPAGRPPPSPQDQQASRPHHPQPQTRRRHNPTTNHDQQQLDKTRRGALNTLTLCREVISILEVTRLRKSRTGQIHWLSFWNRLYDRTFARSLANRVNSALVRVDTLFRAVARDLHDLTHRMEQAVRHATSEREVLRILERMEDDVGARRRRRRKKAHSILNKMRAGIETIPVKVNDELFDDMKRGIFALDVFCDYHPGDPVAEQHESMWPSHFHGERQPVRSAAVSPHLFRQWQAEAVSGVGMPLEAYTANNACYVEDWGNEVDDSQWHSREGYSTDQW
ncbi:hypothetical protein FE257_007895 [Aspergillus nanangensis]|uniref:Uncharacterized protein n=1 Tax=Aspergillus nanangensis TaxID=2582783 RepID=A0AAD4CZ39_ASPNN|nr:hypothetical protein FE257_007895 [Aspergillus nanangensis]